MFKYNFYSLEFLKGFILYTFGPGFLSWNSSFFENELKLVLHRLAWKHRATRDHLVVDTTNTPELII